MSIILDMPDTEYHANPALGSTDLKMYQRSAAHALARKRIPEGEDETTAKRDGKILHCCILEPHQFDAKYVVQPANAPRDLRRFRDAKKPSPETLESIAWWDNWEAANPGKIDLPAKVYDANRRIADAVRSHPELRPYFDASGGQSEVSMFATDPETGLPVKARHDWRVRVDGFRVTLDLKSTQDARDDAFMRDAYRYGYFLQDAHYRDVSEGAGESTDLFLFVAFEKENAEYFDAGTFPIAIYESTERALELGRAQRRKALALAKHCRDLQQYPAYDTSIRPLDAPAWAKE